MTTTCSDLPHRLVFNRLYFTELHAVAAALAAFATFRRRLCRASLRRCPVWPDRRSHRPQTSADPDGDTDWTGDRADRPAAGLFLDWGCSTGVAGPAAADAGHCGRRRVERCRTLAFEHAPPERRGRYASLPQLGSPVGALLIIWRIRARPASGPDPVRHWGWRLPFPGCVSVAWRCVLSPARVDESPVFESRSADSKPDAPVWEIITQVPGTATARDGHGPDRHRRLYMFTTFAIGYGVRVLGIPQTTMVGATLMTSIAELIVIVCVARIVDRVRPWRITFYGALLCAAVAWPAFLMIESRQTSLVFLGVAAGVCTVSAVYAASGALLSGLFPARLRYSGVALAYNLAGVVAGLLPSQQRHSSRRPAIMRRHLRASSRASRSSQR